MKDHSITVSYPVPLGLKIRPLILSQVYVTFLFSGANILESFQENQIFGCLEAYL